MHSWLTNHPGLGLTNHPGLYRLPVSVFGFQLGSGPSRERLAETDSGGPARGAKRQEPSEEQPQKKRAGRLARAPLFTLWFCAAARRLAALGSRPVP